MARHLKALGFFAFVGILAACSGGSGGTTSGTQPATYKTTQLKVKFAVPSAVKLASLVHRLKSVYASGRPSHGSQPHFVGLATTEIDITLTKINGSPAGTTQYNAVVYTQPGGTPNPSCSRNTYPGDDGWQCTTILTAPSASDTYNVQANYCASPNPDGSCPGAPGSLVLISEGNFTVTVPPGGGGSANLTLDPVVGKIDWAPPGSNYNIGLETWTNGSAAPTISGSSYVCNGGGCYDPLLNDAPYTSGSGAPLPATPTWDYLTLNAYDAEGDLIIPSILEPFGYPIFLTAAGAVDNITFACVNTANSVADPDVSLINYDANEPDPSPVPTGDLVNGYPGSAARMNSPLTYGGGSTTDLNGNPVTAVPNNTYAVNFDGGNASYQTSSVDSCQATDSSSPALKSSKYYVGYAFGTVVVVNGRHAHRH